MRMPVQTSRVGHLFASLNGAPRICGFAGGRLSRLRETKLASIMSLLRGDRVLDSGRVQLIRCLTRLSRLVQLRLVQLRLVQLKLEFDRHPTRARATTGRRTFVFLCALRLPPRAATVGC